MAQSFTRLRKLSFLTVFVLILRKSVKSLQVMLNEFILQTQRKETVTSSAFTQARKKFKHTAFVELNEGIISLYYQEQNFKKLYGFRVLAVDGSILILPNNDEVKTEYGSRVVGNHTHKKFNDYTRATFEACYDVLNHIAVQSVLSRGDCHELELVSGMLDSIKSDDLLLLDRGYAAYELLATLNKRKLNYVVRCPKSSFLAVQAMFNHNSSSNLVIDINTPTKHVKKFEALGLPRQTRVRLIRVVLPTGEIEVLATSLIDENRYPIEIFSKLYNLRWGVETFFSKVKSRLCLENFTGKTVESVKQDFWSVILLSNLEPMLTEEVEEMTHTRNNFGKLKKTINKAVSFNAIKNLAFEILTSDTDEDQIIARLTQLFLTNSLSIREDRKSIRRRISDTQSLNFQKRVKKQVF